MIRTASRRAVSSGGSPFRWIAGRTTTTPAGVSNLRIARFATGSRIWDDTRSATSLTDYPGSSALHHEPMLALAYDYQDFDDDDDDDGSLDTTSTSEFAITSAGTLPPAGSNNKTTGSSSTPYPSPSASPPRKFTGGGGGSGRYVLYDQVGV
jgi:hypothetical protein